ncbi:hypothetical protein N657DRAFT_363051 [Parathielavia appendiculata]|uniref:Uncharacterized protein n=1 Tax=Parathielavia appendiculata TaxID=2587402 RepID=A0AAN6U2M9_9PEZI|nr:hypothetical protein N657DRAFT_363051 [Parathielavia appendiculata]
MCRGVLSFRKLMPRARRGGIAPCCGWMGSVSCVLLIRPLHRPANVIPSARRHPQLRGINTIAIAIWATQPGGARLSRLAIKAGTPVLRGRRPVVNVAAPRWTERPGGRTDNSIFSLTLINRKQSLNISFFVPLSLACCVE